mmetsp:Transcript_129743/g.258845  ORF Transcript_129743/g.258845 Transcript_129743/m.258845 type:complete len:94 (+) Transcript_129743:64-345(+)
MHDSSNNTQRARCTARHRLAGHGKTRQSTALHTCCCAKENLEGHLNVQGEICTSALRSHFIYNVKLCHIIAIVSLQPSRSQPLDHQKAYRSRE